MAVTITASEVTAATSYAFAGPQDWGSSRGGDAAAACATAMVEKYGGAAVPEAVANEAVIRICGYFLEGGSGPSRARAS